MKTIVLNENLKPVPEYIPHKQPLPPLIIASLSAWNSHGSLLLEPFDFLAAMLCQFNYFYTLGTATATATAVATDSFDTLVKDLSGAVDPALSTLLALSLEGLQIDRQIFIAGIMASKYSKIFSYEKEYYSCGFRHVYLAQNLKAWQNLIPVLDEIIRIVPSHDFTKVKGILEKLVDEYTQHVPDHAFWNSMINLSQPLGRECGNKTDFISGWLIHFYETGNNIKQEKIHGGLFTNDSVLDTIELADILTTSFNVNLVVANTPTIMIGHGQGKLLVDKKTTVFRADYVFEAKSITADPEKAEPGPS